LQEQIETIHQESRGTYGTPRVYAELAENGVRISRRRVARLMKQAGLEGVSRRRRYRTTRRGNNAQVVPDLVNRDFTADEPNQLWVADIERHEALWNRAVMKGHRHRLVAASQLKLRAA